jgi:hypothetical protein
MKTGISKIEAICIAAISLIATFVLTLTAGGPMFSDELGYIAAGMNGFKDPSILNRYFHIYIQAFFLQLAPSPITGARLFWAVEIVLTALMIYFGIRLLNRKATVVHSLVGVIFFFALPFFLTYSGDTIIDFTSMVVLTAMFFLYLLSIRFEKAAMWLIMGMGAMLFFAFETKEVNVAAGYVVLGLGLDAEGHFHWKQLWQKVRWFLLGIAGGAIVYMILGAIVVKDPFWGFRISEYRAYINGYANLFLTGHEPYDYLGVLLKTLPLFLLFLVSGVQNKERIGAREKVVWYYPFVMVIAITIAWMRSRYGTLDRLLFPALSVMCMFVPQFLAYDFPAEKKEKIRLGLSLLAGMVLVVCLVFLYPYIAKAIGWDTTEFTSSFVLTIVLSGLLILIGWIRQYKRTAFVLALTGVVLLAAEAFYTNFRNVVILRSNQDNFSERLSPFSSFKTSIHYSPSMQMLISLDLRNSYYLLGNGLDDIVGLFDLYFDRPAQRQNFTLVEARPELQPDILQDTFDYVLMTNGDWSTLSQQPGVEQQIEALYSVSNDKTGRIYFLEKK